MLSTGAIDLENLAAIYGQPFKIIETGASTFYTPGHPIDELRGGVSALRYADPDRAPPFTMNVLHDIGGLQLNIGAVECP